MLGLLYAMILFHHGQSALRSWDTICQAIDQIVSSLIIPHSITTLSMKFFQGIVLSYLIRCCWGYDTTVSREANKNHKTQLFLTSCGHDDMNYSFRRWMIGRKNPVT